MGRGMPFLDGAEHAEIRGVVRVQRAGDAGEKLVRGELLQELRRQPELHGENAVVQGEAEVVQRAQAEAGARPEEEAVAPWDDGV